MNIVQIKYFRAVCEHKSVSQAAEILHISQPSLSLAIKELEREFGVELFRRHHKGMALTSAGEELLRLSQSFLQHAEEVKRVMLDLGNGKTVLRLGVPPMIGSLTLPKIFDEFVKDNADIELSIIEAGRMELSKLLEENRLDMVILPHNAPFEKEFKSVEITQFEIVCCANEKMPIAKLKKVTPKDLDGQPVVTFSDAFFQTEQIKKWFNESDVQPNVILQTSQLSTLQNMIESGTAVGFMFSTLVEKERGLVAVPMVEPMLVFVSLVWKQKTTIFNSMKKFINYLKTFKT